MALLNRKDPTQFDVGGSLLTTKGGQLSYWDGGQLKPVPAGMRPVQTDTGGGYFSPEQIQLLAAGGIGAAGLAGAGAEGLIGASGPTEVGYGLPLAEEAGAGSAGAGAG